MDSPQSWTDIVQAIAALIAIPGAIAAFYILIKKDKARESEIKSLSEIANKLTQMLQASENRYKSSKKPHMEITLEHNVDNSFFHVYFKNTNRNTTLTNFKFSVIPELKLEKYSIIEHDGQQNFSIKLNYSELLDNIILSVDYKTDENYVFIQDIFIFNRIKKYVLSTSAIVEESKTPLN